MHIKRNCSAHMLLLLTLIKTALAQQLSLFQEHTLVAPMLVSLQTVDCIATAPDAA